MMPKPSEITHSGLYQIVRAGLSLGLLSYLLASLDWQLMENILVNAKPSVLFLSFLLVNVSIFLSAFKWKEILKNLNKEVKFRTLTRIYYEGAFLNNFLPSNIGGDGFRWFRLSEQIESRQDAFVSILIDRISGFLVLIALSSVSGILLVDRFSFNPKNLVNQNRGVCAFLVVGILACLVLGFIVRKKIHSIYKDHFSEAKELLTVKVLLVSLLFYALVCVNNYLISVAYGLNVEPMYYFIFIPIIMLLLFLPISINGIGVREMTFILLFGSVGIEEETAFLLGITPYILLLATSLMGGIFLVFGQKRVPSV